MAMKQGQGNFINGFFVNEGSITLTSNNPSCDYEPVFSVRTDLGHVPVAIHSARNAYKSWSYLTNVQRINAVLSLKRAFVQNEAAMAHAISQEMGKIYSEALSESKSLSARCDLIIEHGLKRVATESLYDLRAETRYHPQGVLAIIGPYNFPAHLINAHVIPSILLGNTVVIKPSEVCPMVAEVYAKCVLESDLPKGVINIIHGDGQVGRALCAHENIDGVLFTGSYKTGRALKELLIDQPHKILALEMGSKNFAVVMDDADLKQAVSEVILGGYLTTGQRCTATSRVLVHGRVFDRFTTMLLKIASELKPSKAHESGLFGPMATKTAMEHFLQGLQNARSEGAEVLLNSQILSGGAFVTPSVYQVSEDHPPGSYLGEELFGPNLCLEPFTHLDHAIARINESPYGLSNAIFTLSPNNSERMINETKSGVINVNRSTNNAFGQMPFGGVKRSGNQRAAGIDAVRYATFPMAILCLPYGESQAVPSLKEQVARLNDETIPLPTLAMRHEIEAAFETYGIHCEYAALDRICYSRTSFSALKERENRFFEELVLLVGDAVSMTQHFVTIDASKLASTASLENLLSSYAIESGLTLKQLKPLAINVPRHLALPKSRAMLDRLYRGGLVPADKKALVADLDRSRGPYLASIDDNPLVLFDAASQIATFGAGFLADTFQNAYDCHDLDLAILNNVDLSQDNIDDGSPYYLDAIEAKEAFERFLNEKSGDQFRSISYGASGAEANEIAFDLARVNGPGGTRIIAFEGAFHGRTIMALQATYNKEKRGPFAFHGYEASFISFPELKDLSAQPKMPACLLESVSRGDIPVFANDDMLLEKELRSLAELKDEALKGDICAVIIEPMQCEGGDKYASDRFFSLLRALTRALKLPLIFDEVQTGFNLGREFFWYQQLNLVDQYGRPELPDCITLAKKAQLGACLSVWPNSRKYTPHIIQLKRGLLHGKAMNQERARMLEKKTLNELRRLKDYFPELISGVRACGFAFAFDMPTKELASELIDQRFLRGFMAYIAGERTLRFRLNTVTSDQLLYELFEKLYLCLIDVRDGQRTERVPWKTRSDVAEKPVITNVEIHDLSEQSFSHFEPEMRGIEESAYEVNRRDSMDDLKKWLKLENGIGIVMTCEIDGVKKVAGYAIGGPLEHAMVNGALEDPHRLRYNTFYSANITLDEGLRGLGFGALLKNEQIRRVALKTNADGSLRYLNIASRNRVGRASSMSRINASLGAYVVETYDNQYNEPGAKAAYYRLPVAKSVHVVKEISHPGMMDCSNSLETPFVRPPASLLAALKSNKIRSAVGSKLTLSNWATCNMIRYSELLREVMPKHLKHTYFTSGRDEVLDKGLRSLRFHRPDADIAIGFSHQWLGNITAAARSLSHDENQTQPFGFFAWPKIRHPALGGTLASIKQLKETIADSHPDKFLGIVIELTGEKSALCFNEEFLNELDTVRKNTKIPLVFVENASSLGRSGVSCFLSDSLSVKANMVLWYTGGQLGQVFVDDEYFVEKPLTLISTWDGDEISMTRAYHHLLYASLSN
ncbi:MAG TPA: aldehyde dehydrogenase family protein, partial [Myxococcota bacterium]|nr:aldehyde dehydrogenase family protein [Myxococcota bacterium]